MTIPQYRVIYSQRSTLGLEIDESGALIVRSPHRLSRDKIEGIIRQKSTWIKRKQAMMRARVKPLNKQYQAGEQFYYLGKAYSLTIKSHQAQALMFTDKGFILDESAQSHAHQYFHDWYRSTFTDYATPKVQTQIARHGFHVAKLTIRYAKTRWGSCSEAHRIMLNYLLLMAPPAVIDSVIIHELCHTVYPNHSRRFWQLVARYDPHYQAHNQWLKENGARLHHELP